MINPFSKITEQDLITYSGKLIAISFETGEILASANNAEQLDAEMIEYFPDIKYAQICLPYSKVAI